MYYKYQCLGLNNMWFFSIIWLFWICNKSLTDLKVATRYTRLKHATILPTNLQFRWKAKLIIHLTFLKTFLNESGFFFSVSIHIYNKYPWLKDSKDKLNIYCLKLIFSPGTFCHSSQSPIVFPKGWLLVFLLNERTVVIKR